MVDPLVPQKKPWFSPVSGRVMKKSCSLASLVWMLVMNMDGNIIINLWLAALAPPALRLPHLQKPWGVNVSITSFFRWGTGARKLPYLAQGHTADEEPQN